ncbi:hypothetical protein TRIP_D440303 [uncultured Paludibacter sp.]|uniref:Uncharacterized protein n=1 Tax=uncultured Paludibacter sp. TaxID=497635 RepID=A0A653AKS1_9BACT|nr:hypothetical protein TRIP_D440303 [uncultured Paludibacter sp.]
MYWTVQNIFRRKIKYNIKVFREKKATFFKLVGNNKLLNR